VRKGLHCDSKQQWRTQWDHSIIACSRHVYVGVVLRAHSVVVNRIYTATRTERLQQHPLLLTMNCTNSKFFLFRLHLAQPSHPSHSTILLQAESPSGKCVKLHTVAANNNRDHPTRSLYYCLFVAHICGYYSSCISRSWWIAHSTQCQRRGCNSTICWRLPE